MFATAAGGWSATRTAGTERSAVELGADRVLTVQANSRTALVHAVRRADPEGRHAMAVVVDRASSPPILAVDSPRLAAVARWRPEYGPVDALTGALAANPLPAAAAADHRRPAVAAGPERPGPRRSTLTAVLQNEATGAAVPVQLGPIPRGTHTVSAPVARLHRRAGLPVRPLDAADPAERRGPARPAADRRPADRPRR